jgi:hypothetical protein
MVDRESRKKMAEVIRAYFDEKITAFEFDDALKELDQHTQDETVHDLTTALWFHYDDCKDHKIVATKEQWDYFHRILLVLESGGRLECGPRRYAWSVRQLIAALVLVFFVGAAFRLDWWEYLVIVSMPFGLVSMLLSFWNSKASRKPTEKEMALTPFLSISELLSCRRKVMGFSKKPYPFRLESRKVRDSIAEIMMWVPGIMMWLMFAPLVLLFQTMPDIDEKTSVRMP